MLNRIDRGDGVVEIAVDRPPANALSPELIRSLLDTVRALPKEGADALVLSGRPGMFSAGLDVPALLQLDRDGVAAMWGDFFELMRALAGSPVPVAAAITGHSPAGGAVLALFCDRRIMAEGDFKIGLNEVQVGISLPMAIFYPMRRLLGARHAERLGVGGLLVSAEEAAAIGLVDELAPMDEVVPRCVDRMKALLRLPRRTMLDTRKTLRADLLQALNEDGDAPIHDVVDRWFEPETQAALTALVERLAKRG